MSRQQSDLAVVCIRLRRDDIDRAKAVAASAGIGYQRWVRERVSEAVRDGSDERIFKIKGTSTLAIARASTVDAARAAARTYGEELATRLKLPITAFTGWIADADVAPLPETAGVVAWAGVGPPIVAARSRRKARPSRGPSRGKRR